MRPIAFKEERAVNPMGRFARKERSAFFAALSVRKGLFMIRRVSHANGVFLQGGFIQSIGACEKGVLRFP